MITTELKIAAAVGAFALFAAYTGGVYYVGGKGPRADLAALKVNIKVAQDKQVAQDEQRETDHKKLIGEKDEQRKQAVTANDSKWKSYIAGLPKSGSSAGKNAQPVPITAEGLNDAADRARVSAAVSIFRDEVTAAAYEFRDEVAGQLAECQANTDALTRAQAWAIEEQKINQ